MNEPLLIRHKNKLRWVRVWQWRCGKNVLQLPRSAEEYIGRIELDISPAKNNVRIARGENDVMDWLEPLARDNPDLGFPGGGSQLLLEMVEPEVVFKMFGEF